jgi:hypothetical protein
LIVATVAPHVKRNNVGKNEPAGILAKYRLEGAFGHFHNWIPMQFDHFMIKVYFDEDKDGNRYLEEAVRVPRISVDKPTIHLGSPRHDITWKLGTRQIAQTVLTAANTDLRIVGTPLRTNYLCGGGPIAPTRTGDTGTTKGRSKATASAGTSAMSSNSQRFERGD